LTLTGTATTWVTLNTGDPWSNLRVKDLAFVDFNGNGITDVFSADGSSWRWHPSGQGVVYLEANVARVSDLRFGDLNGDGRTDVFYGNGRRWRYKSAGTGPWIQIALASEESRDVWVANFDSDPKADIFFPQCY